MSNDKLAEALRLQIKRWRGSWRRDCNNDECAILDSCALEIEGLLQTHAAEAAQPQAQNSEWVMVPREPTQAMLDANGDCDSPEGKAWLEKDARTTWAAMLAAVENKS